MTVPLVGASGTALKVTTIVSVPESQRVVVQSKMYVVPEVPLKEAVGLVVGLIVPLVPETMLHTPAIEVPAASVVVVAPHRD